MRILIISLTMTDKNIDEITENDIFGLLNSNKMPLELELLGSCLGIGNQKMAGLMANMIATVSDAQKNDGLYSIDISPKMNPKECSEDVEDIDDRNYRDSEYEKVIQQYTIDNVTPNSTHNIKLSISSNKVPGYVLCLKKLKCINSDPDILTYSLYNSGHELRTILGQSINEISRRLNINDTSVLPFEILIDHYVPCSLYNNTSLDILFAPNINSTTYTYEAEYILVPEVEFDLVRYTRFIDSWCCIFSDYLDDNKTTMIVHNKKLMFDKLLIKHDDIILTGSDFDIFCENTNSENGIEKIEYDVNLQDNYETVVTFKNLIDINTTLRVEFNIGTHHNQIKLCAIGYRKNRIVTIATDPHTVMDSSGLFADLMVSLTDDVPIMRDMRDMYDIDVDGIFNTKK